MPPMRIIAKFERVSSRIQELERGHLSPKESSRFGLGKWATIYPEEGLRTPVYRSSPPNDLYDRLDQFVKTTKVDLSNVKAADLGSGFAAACVALSYFCKSVTGFEMFQGFIKDARTVVREFGYRNIKFKQGDFIKADLSKFKLWYVYYPFFEDFGNTMEKKIDEAASGTLIILRSGAYPELLQKRNVEQIFPFDPIAFIKLGFSVIRRK